MSAKLDSVDSLKVGEGRLQFGLAGTSDFRSGRLAGFADVEKRLSRRTSLFGRGEVFYDSKAGAGASAIGGLRIRF